MTGLSASRFGLTGRGEITVGNIAALVVSDATRVIDGATFAQPNMLSAGIDLVVVAGVSTYREQRLTGARAGRFLSRLERV